MKKILKGALPVTLILILASCTDLSQEFYDKVTPDTFFKMKKM
jgi:hypothetical protein